MINDPQFLSKTLPQISRPDHRPPLLDDVALLMWHDMWMITSSSSFLHQPLNEYFELPELLFKLVNERPSAYRPSTTYVACFETLCQIDWCPTIDTSTINEFCLFFWNTSPNRLMPNFSVISDQRSSLETWNFLQILPIPDHWLSTSFVGKPRHLEILAKIFRSLTIDCWRSEVSFGWNSIIFPTHQFDHRPSMSSTDKLKTLCKFHQFNHWQLTNSVGELQQLVNLVHNPGEYGSSISLKFGPPKWIAVVGLETLPNFKVLNYYYYY